MSNPSHATLATFTIDLTMEEQQREALHAFIVPGVRQSPGFVAGNWTIDRTTSESLVLLTFDSLDAAEAMSENIIGNAANQAASGLILVSVRILEVAAAAGAR